MQTRCILEVPDHCILKTGYYHHSQDALTLRGMKKQGVDGWLLPLPQDVRIPKLLQPMHVHAIYIHQPSSSISASSRKRLWRSSSLVLWLLPFSLAL